MSENGVEIIDICSDEKENVLKEKTVKKDGENINNNNIVIINEKKASESAKPGDLLSPPRKKLKQESIVFPVTPKDETQKDLNKSIDENGVYDTDSSKKTATPGSSKKAAKSPGLSKEEKEKQRQEREHQRLERQKEFEEKKRIKEEEKKRKEDERLQKLAEKEKKDLEKKVEKEKREQERKDKERIREEEKKKKEEERLKREEEKRKRDETKEAERREKEAEREKREAEKRLEEEKKLLKEEAERKKKAKAANQFKSFFTKKVEKKPAVKPAEISRFANFQVTPNMTIAPCIRRTDFTKCQIDKSMKTEVPDCASYLEELSIKIANNKLPAVVTRRKLRKEAETKRKEDTERCRNHEIDESKNGDPNSKKNNSFTKELEPKIKRKRSSLSSSALLNKSLNAEVVVIEDDNSNNPCSSEDEDEDENETSFVEEKKLMKSIYLKFEENTRPPYYGTWRKKSNNITGRRPFAQDRKMFNYEVDSDEEWIDEPGEDCSDNAEEEDEEDKETEDDQDGFFVPHGYLSDDEGVPDEDEDSDNEENEEKEKAPVSKDIADARREQDKLKSKVVSFEVSFKKKLKPRKPICIGIKFTNNIDDIDPLLKEFLKISLYKSQGDSEAAATGDGADVADEGGDHGNKKAVSTEPNDSGSIPLTVPEEAMVLLLKLVHGNSTSVKQMIAEFKTYWCEYVQLNNLAEVVRATISKTQLIKKIQTIATKGNNTQLGKLCYTVNSDILEKYGVADLELGSGLVYPIPKQQDSIVSSNIDNSITSTSHEGNMDNSSPVNGSKKETHSSGGITLEEHVSTNEPLSNATPAVEEPMELE